jgi:hypothetical protein
MKVVLNCFSHENITESKRVLVQEFNSMTGAMQYLTDRRNSSARPAHEAELDDIIGILDVADTVHAMQGYSFVAASLQSMPKYGPEEINMAVAADQQVMMDDALHMLSSAVQMNSDTICQQVGQSISRSATET